MISWPLYSGLVVRQHLLVGVHVEAELLNSWLGSKRKEEEESHSHL